MRVIRARRSRWPWSPTRGRTRSRCAASSTRSPTRSSPRSTCVRATSWCWGRAASRKPHRASCAARTRFRSSPRPREQTQTTPTSRRVGDFHVCSRGKTSNELSATADTVDVMSSSPAIEAIDLLKRFGDTAFDKPAVDGLSFTVPTGTVLGLLGPNGAGKTTIVRMMTTLSVPTSGTATVAGFDVVREPDMVRRNMGLTGQVATVDELLTGRENIRMIGGLYGITRRDLNRLSDQLLEQFSIADAADRTVRSYSGGMRRRLDLAVSLIASPPVLFLDEPTTGLDPRSRSDLWDMLHGLVAQGTTLLLTTQYLEEA